MIYSNLFQNILIAPASSLKANQLLVISKDVNAEMITHHFEQLDASGYSIEVDLIVGSTVEVGISADQHHQISEICGSSEYSSSLHCSYIHEGEPVISNFYIWLKEEQPVIAFFGSASYTANRFDTISRDVFVEVNAQEALKYRNSILGDAVSCFDDEAMTVVQQVPVTYHNIEWMFTGRSSLNSQLHKALA